MLELLSVPFFQRSLLTGSLLSLVLATLGVFVVSRRLSFFSDAIGHSALTGIALGLLLGINPFMAALVFTVVVAAGLALIRTHSKLSLDTLLGVFFAASVSLGVILVQRSPGYQTDLISFLFGDILTISRLDVVLSFILTIVVLLCLTLLGKKFVAITFNQDVARAEGVSLPRYEMIFLCLLAGTIALAIKQVGVILVTAMVVIPAASAQYLARSLVSFFIGSMIVGLLSTIIGMILSVGLQTPSGPTIVLTGSLFFIGAFLWGRSR